MYDLPQVNKRSYHTILKLNTGTPEQLKVRGESAYTGKSFETVIREEIKFLQECGISPTVSDDTWREKVLQHMPMTHGGHSIVARGLYVLQLRPWAAQWPADQISVHSLSEIKGTKGDIQRTMDDVFDYLHLPPHDCVDVEAKNTRKYEPMSAESRAILNEFYAPYNAELFKFLERELVW